MITVRVDATGFEQFLQHLELVLEEESIPQVAKTHKRLILGLTKQGADAHGEILHAYNPDYAKIRAAKELTTSVKDLRFTGGMLDSLELVDNILTVGDEHQNKALGQVTGVDGKWGYVHDFLDISEDSNEIALDELVDFIQGRI